MMQQQDPKAATLFYHTETCFVVNFPPPERQNVFIFPRQEGGGLGLRQNFAAPGSSESLDTAAVFKLAFALQEKV